VPRILSLLAALSLSSVGLQAQTFSVSGRDTAGTPVEQVGLLLFDHNGKHVATTRTGASGIYPDGSSLQDVVVPEMVDYVIVLRGAEVGVRYGSIGHNGIVLIATKNADWWRRR
jgi:hypothetical protein